jgi:hypothetical protein
MRVVLADVLTDNGVIHAVNKVIMANIFVKNLNENLFFAGFFSKY